MIHPYTNDDFENLAKARQILQELVPFFNAMEECKTDCSAKKEQLKFLDDILASYQRGFFGHQT